MKDGFIFHLSLDIFHWSLAPRKDESSRASSEAANEKYEITTVPTLVEQGQLFASTG
jgi:hypothetical protein